MFRIVAIVGVYNAGKGASGCDFSCDLSLAATRKSNFDFRLLLKSTYSALDATQVMVTTITEKLQSWDTGVIVTFA